MTLKNKENPPITNYLGIDFKNNGLETFNDERTKITPSEKQFLIKKQNSSEPLNFINKPPDIFITTVDPAKCIPWKFADRDDHEMGDINSLGISIKNNGQQEPILMRSATSLDVPGIEYEIIFGRRRWKACLEYGLQLKAIIKNITDQDAAIAQKEENENRENISDYSRAFYYKKLLDESVFESISMLAKRMMIGKTSLLDILSYTRINKKILEAMPKPYKLTKAAAVKLATISQKISSEEELNALIGLAPQIQDGKIAFRNIEHELRKKLSLDCEGVIEKKSTFKFSGNHLFISKKQKNGELVVSINKEILKKIPQTKIEQLIFDFIVKDYGLKQNDKLSITEAVECPTRKKTGEPYDDVN